MSIRSSSPPPFLEPNISSIGLDGVLSGWYHPTKLARYHYEAPPPQFLEPSAFSMAFYRDLACDAWFCRRVAALASGTSGSAPSTVVATAAATDLVAAQSRELVVSGGGTSATQSMGPGVGRRDREFDDELSGEPPRKKGRPTLDSERPVASACVSASAGVAGQACEPIGSRHTLFDWMADIRRASVSDPLYRAAHDLLGAEFRGRICCENMIALAWAIMGRMEMRIAGLLYAVNISTLRATHNRDLRLALRQCLVAGGVCSEDVAKRL